MTPSRQPLITHRHSTLTFLGDIELRHLRPPADVDDALWLSGLLWRVARSECLLLMANQQLEVHTVGRDRTSYHVLVDRAVNVVAAARRDGETCDDLFPLDALQIFDDELGSIATFGPYTPHENDYAIPWLVLEPGSRELHRQIQAATKLAHSLWQWTETVDAEPDPHVWIPPEAWLNLICHDLVQFAAIRFAHPGTDARTFLESLLWPWRNSTWALVEAAE